MTPHGHQLHPSHAVFPPPNTPPIGLPRPTLPPELRDQWPPAAPEFSPDITDELAALGALANMSVLEPVDREPIDLPIECRSALLQLLEVRSQLWSRIDDAYAEAERLSRLTARTTGRSAAPVGALTDTGDPELEAEAAAMAAEREVAELQKLGAEVERLQQLQTAKRRRPGRTRREVRTAEARAQLELGRQRLRAFLEHGVRNADASRVRLAELLDANAVTLREVERNVGRAEHAPWEMTRWVNWSPSNERFGGDLRLGAFTETRSGETLAVPCVTPLIGSGRSLVVASDGEEEHQAAQSLVQSLVLRAAIGYPQQSRYTLLDPAANGLSFPMARHLPNAELVGTDVRRRLDDVSAHVHRIVTTYLDARATTFEELPEEMRLGESYHFVVAADFPNAYDARAAEALEQLARTGPRAGVYVILHHNRDRMRSAPPELANVTFEGALVVEVGEQTVTIGDSTGTLAFDAAPAAAIQEAVLHRIKSLPPRDRAVPWDELNRIRDVQWWTETSEHRIHAPIGRHGAGELIDISFGTDVDQQRSCIHGVLGAMPGAGKSTLLHNLICSLAIRYSPAELRMLLIDGKYGVEFRPYRALPHASVVSLRTSPTLARSVLHDLVEEMGRRNSLFVDHDVVDLAGYRALGQPAGPLPRLLLIVDEYQQLFDGDREGEASAALLRLSQQGRSAGIHFFLASQRFDTGAMQHRNEIFGNVHLRVAMQLSQADAASLTDFGVTGRRLITNHCDRAGRVVVNDRGGDDSANTAGRASLLNPERRDALIATLARKAARDLPRLERPVVLDGTVAPSLVENPHVRTLLGPVRCFDAEQLGSFARTPVVDGGLGCADWTDHELPFPVFLGRNFDVRGHTTAVVRRRLAENVVFLGERTATRLGMLAASTMSVALARPPAELDVQLIDAGSDGLPWSDTLHRLSATLGMLGVATNVARKDDEIAAMIRATRATVDARAADPTAVDVTVVLVVHEPERVAALQRTADDYGRSDSDLGRDLRRILSVGPALGVHVLLSTNSLGSFRSVLPDRVLTHEIRHRIVLRLPEEDSFVVVRTTAAATLQADGQVAEAALLYDAVRQTAVRFQPYTLGLDATDEESAKLMEQIASITEHLSSRRA